MNDRTKRPSLTPEDDPSIPVLTERLTLPVPISRQATPAAATDAVVDSMVFPRAASVRMPEPAVLGPGLPAFDLPPKPSAASAPAAKPAQPAVAVDLAAKPATPANPIAAAVPAHMPAPVVLPDADAIRNAVLDDLATRLPREIESLMRKQLAGSIEAAVQAASTDLAARIRNAAAQSLQNLVEQAVKAEIARLRLPPPPK